ncbi:MULTISPECIES: TIGR02647 family protein [Pseudomonas]|uniref:TIGR02647 family protein n=1 Tax=Pseudomonas TaxID=286 RepID=UPI00123B20DA|nr:MULTISPECIES: TIGR02647 family protein [Pseudomonas]QIB50581.1 TIGR02647 family protein [Pseudomonas sp. OIL-1]QJD60025.1 TIGR02647 family protein [Pseudomonas sp. gcc21]
MLTPEEIEDINLLGQFNLANTLEGLKIHAHDAPEQTVAAARRLHEKGLVTQTDGGYLTSLGIEAAEHCQALLTILR